MANAATGADQAVVPSCLQKSTEQTLHDPVGTLADDAGAAIDDPQEFVKGEADCVLSVLPS